MNITFKNIALLFFITLIFITGSWFRFTGLNWDQNSHLHPDERFLTMVIMKMETPHSFYDYMDEKKSTYNPRNQKDTWYVYGTLPPVMLHTLAGMTHQFSYDEITLLGRKLSAVFDLITLLLVMALAQTIWKSLWASTLAGACYACCVLSIQHSHFFIVDVYLTTFITASLLALILWWKREHGIWLCLCLLCYSLALACKISAAFFTPVITALFFCKMFVKKDQWAHWLLQAFSAGCIAYLSLRFAAADMFASPMIFDPRLTPRLIESFQHLKGYESSLYFPPILQWISRTPISYPLNQLANWGFGWPLTFCSIIGCALALKSKRYYAILPLLLFAWILLTGARTLMAQRYFLPMAPVACTLAGWALFRCWAADKHLRPAGRICTISILFGMLTYATLFTSIYRHPHPRNLASDWLMQHVTPAETVLCEYWDDALPLHARHPGQAYPKIKMLPVFDVDTPEKQATLIESMTDADWIVLSSSRAWGTVTRAPARFPMMLKYYHALFNGDLGYRHAATFTSFPHWGNITLLDHEAEESLRVFDHPIVFIFEKTAHFSPQKAHHTLTPKAWGTTSNDLEDSGSPLPPFDVKPLLTPKSN